MGYTHYWRFTENPKDLPDGEAKFEKAVNLFKKGMALLPNNPETGKPVEIAGGNGNGKPTINSTMLCFNGKGDESYETFRIDLDDPNGYDFNFCKTAHQPYDAHVCLALRCIKQTFGKDFRFSSDGYIEGENMDYGWRVSREVMHKIK